jgi:hypothetical protein
MTDHRPPMTTLFRERNWLRVEQADAHRRSDAVLPLPTDEDPLGVGGFAAGRLPLAGGAGTSGVRDAPEAGHRIRQVLVRP